MSSQSFERTTSWFAWMRLSKNVSFELPEAGKVRVQSRLFSLDVLRGLAIALVLLRHFPPSDILAAGPFEPFVSALSRLGWIGVDLFFVLSGFLISGLIFSEYDRTGAFDARRFWLRRGFKIWPAYFAAYGGMSAARILWETIRNDDAKASQIFSDAMCNAAFLQNYLPCHRWSHSWSLAVEEHFYTGFAVVCALACWAGARRALDGKGTFSFLMPLFVVASIVALYLRWQECFPAYVQNGEIAYSRSHLRIDSLLCGVAISYLVRYQRWRIPAALTTWPLAMLALACAFLWPILLPSGETPYSESVGLTLIYLSFGLVVAWAALNPESGSRFGGPAGALFRMLAWLGVYSYTIYLAHAAMFGIPGVETARQGVLASALPLLGDYPTLWLDRVGFLGLSVLGGVVLSHLIERPFLRLRERVLPR